MSCLESLSSTDTFLSNAASDKKVTGTGCLKSSPRSFATSSAMGLMRESQPPELFARAALAPAGAATADAPLAPITSATTATASRRSAIMSS